MTRLPQRAFSGGIMAPGMYPRRDIPKWATGLKDADNVILLAEGGAQSRAGTTLASGYDNGTVDGHVWLVPFMASATDTYMLEFGEQVCRVLRNGGYLLSDAFAAQSVTSITAANPARIEMVDAAAASNFTVGRLVFLSDPNGTSAFHQAILRVQSISSEFITFQMVGGQNADTTTGSWGSIGSGATLQEIYEFTSPFEIEDMATMQFTQDVDTMFFAHPDYQPQQLVRTGDVNWAFSSMTFQPEIGQVVDSPATITGITQANPGVVTTSAAHGLTNGQPVTLDNVVGMTEVNGNTYRVANVTSTTFELQDIDSVNVDSSAFTAYVSGGTVAELGVTEKVGTGSETHTYKVAAVDAESGEEGLPSAEVSVTNDLTTAGNQNIFFWPSVTGAGTYRVYKDFNGIYGFIGITEGNEFVDENITPDTADNPQSARDPFSGADDKPSVTAFVEQRLTFAATNNNPQAVEMGNSVAPLNFNRALTPGASDAISFRMRSQTLNKVLHIVDGERPLILTSGGEWYMATADDAPLATGNFSLRAVTRRGSAVSPRPVIVGNMCLHVDRSGNSLREFSLDVERDTPSADLTILAKHLFKGKTITSMAYSQAPDSVVWVTLDDGACYSLSYLQEHEIWGWTKHTFGGSDVKVKQVAVVTEGARDVPYFVIERTLFGGTVTLVERLADRNFATVSDSYCVDCGLTFSAGSPTSTYRGYLHLRGEAVSVLADGNVLDGVTVDATGQVDLGRTASAGAIGLGYDAYIVTLPADMGDQIQGLGSSVGRFVSAVEVAVSVVNTRGIAIGLENGTLDEVKEFTGVDPIPFATLTHVVTIQGDWSRDQSIEVRQTHPLPMTITAVAPSWEIEEDG